MTHGGDRRETVVRVPGVAMEISADHAFTWGKQMAVFIGFVVLLVLALASNGAYAFVQDSQFFYRTQIVSRYWSSIALALLAFSIGRLAARRPWFALAIPAGFVALGSYGGLDRQDYFLAYWRRHRLELSSILRVAPSLAPDSVLALRVPAGPPYLASAAQYLARKRWPSTGMST